MQIVIKPFDMLFFRDGKPFDMGNETFATTNIFINPVTLHGALVSTYISQYNLDFQKHAENLKNNLKIKFISLIDEKTLLFPVPVDLAKEKEDKEKNKNQLKLLKTTDKKVCTNLKIGEKLLVSEKEVEKFSCFVRERRLKKYLNLAEEVFDYVPVDHKISTEFKTGIGLSKTSKTVEEGKLYRLNLLRLLNGTSIFVDFEVENCENKGFKNKQGYLKLGGESKIAWYKEIEKPYEESLRINDSIFKDGYFKLYLLTPAIFDKGYISSWMEEGNYKGLNLELVSLSIEKPRSISGFDLKVGKPKKLYKTVPEGSIFMFKTNESIEKIINTFHFKSISDEYSNQGFGIALVGGVQS